MTKLILVRHGETVWNAARRFQGQSDIELSEKGRWQARRTAEHLANEPIDVVYASDLVRCRVTAQLVMQGRNVEISTRPDLRELNFGGWEGLTQEEITQRDPAALDKLRQENSTFRPPGGETIPELQARVLGVLEHIRETNAGQTVLIVAHINPLRTMVYHVIGTNTNPTFRMPLGNCSITMLNARDDGQRGNLLLLNDTCHLNGYDENRGLN